MDHPVIEVPDGRVHRDAMFYCTCGGTLDTWLGYDRLGDYDWFPPAKESEWAAYTSLHFVRHVLPREIGPHWEYKRFVASADQVARFSPDLVLMGNDFLADHIPDIQAWPPWAIVSSRAREMLEDIAPDASLFITVNIHRKSGGLVPGEHHYWIIRDRFFLREERATEPLPMKRLPFSGPFAFPDVAWQLLNNQPLREFLREFPFWGYGSAFMDLAFNQGTFVRLKKAGLTGLVESTAEYAADVEYYESIGHIP